MDQLSVCLRESLWWVGTILEDPDWNSPFVLPVYVRMWTWKLVLSGKYRCHKS